MWVWSSTSMYLILVQVVGVNKKKWSIHIFFLAACCYNNSSKSSMPSALEHTAHHLELWSHTSHLSDSTYSKFFYLFLLPWRGLYSSKPTLNLVVLWMSTQIVLGDKSEQKAFNYTGITCFNPGSFSNDFTFVVYRPCSQEVELSAV